jgi:hypothetical protein
VEWAERVRRQAQQQPSSEEEPEALPEAVGTSIRQGMRAISRFV